MQIRPYVQEQDETQLLQLWLESTTKGQPFIPEQFWKKQLPLVRDEYLPASETWVAEKDGQLLGFVALLGNLVGGLFVLPAAQGQQVGSSLIAHARTLRPQSLYVEVYEKNLKARKFYQKCGFVFNEARTDEATNEVLHNLVLLY